MRQTQALQVRPATTGMRRMLVVASALVFIVGFQLYILTEQTERFFAWTIQSPLTAAFLGGGYWASFAMELLASRRRTWAHARIAVPAVLIFTTLTLVATLLHLDRFHLSATDPVTRTVTWAWLIVYAVVPPLMAVLLVRQMAIPGVDPPRQAPLPVWVRGVLIVHTAIMAPIGALMLLSPQAVMPVWPWTLTPLTARAIGTWLLALGVAAAHSAWENDWPRVEVATLSYLVFGVIELIALVRYGQELAWSSAAGRFYVLFMLSVLALGLYGWWKSTRARTPAGPAQVGAAAD